MSGLEQLAHAAGLQIDWQDASGRHHRVSEESQRKVLSALGYPAESESEIAASLEKRRQEELDCRFLSVDLGQDLTLAHAGGEPAEVELEDGSALTLPIAWHGSEPRLTTSAITEPGYHKLRLDGRQYTLAVAPERCVSVSERSAGRRIWGPAVQIPSLRDTSGTGFGDFGTLATSAKAFASLGADALAISPAHALFPADPSRFSPYGPSSRLFLNILFADPRLAGGQPAPGSSGELIDWEAAIPAKLLALRHAYRSAPEGLRQSVAAFRSENPEAERHATFDALHEHFFAKGCRGWQDWPAEYHDPAGAAVARFAADHAEEVAFYLFAQWLARESLTAAQKAATDAGMTVGLISDLAVGMDGGGSHAWSRPGELLSGLSIGAPPDPLGPLGQDWGLTGFCPIALRQSGYAGFIETLRAAFDRTGGVRIDHVLGLRRLWVIPEGSNSAEGAYITMPLEDMLRVLAIESARAGAVVIGEDLGTIPQGLQPMLEAREIVGMDVLWFQRWHDGTFIPPAQWRSGAAAMTGTHDLPTVAGWWKGRDLDWAWQLGRRPEDADEARDREDRQRDREALWRAFEASGAAEAPIPSPERSEAVVDAAAAHVAKAPGALALFPLEDLLGLEEQPNLPGTIDEHPNWRRRMPAPAEELVHEPEIRRRAERIAQGRQ